MISSSMIRFDPFESGGSIGGEIDVNVIEAMIGETVLDSRVSFKV